jgi:hypothetical protein
MSRAKRPARQDELAAYVARVVAELAAEPLTPAQQDTIRAAFRHRGRHERRAAV